MAMKKVGNIPGDSNESRFSQPSGKPASKDGNLMIWISILMPRDLVLSIALETKGTL